MKYLISYNHNNFIRFPDIINRKIVSFFDKCYKFNKYQLVKKVILKYKKNCNLVLTSLRQSNYTNRYDVILTNSKILLLLSLFATGSKISCTEEIFKIREMINVSQSGVIFSSQI